MMRYLRLVILGLAVCCIAPLLAGQSPKPVPKASHAPRFLIIAPKAFHPALKEFVTHKRRLQPTELVALETVLRGANGVDDAEKLKRGLYLEWRRRGLGSVLLVGDIDVLPVRFMVLDRVTPNAFDYAFYPCDLYYADLAKADGSFDDWNARKDAFHARYFGEVRGEKNKQDPINYDQVHYLPEIAVGRWPVSSPEEVRWVAQKTMAYEKSVIANRDSRLRQAALFAVDGWVENRDFTDRLAAKLAADWQVEKRYYSDARRQSGTPPPDHQQLRELFNQGLGLAIHSGHGQTDAWDKCFNLRDLNFITNTAAVPVVISAGCSTAYFAPLPPYESYVDESGQEHAGSDRGEVFRMPPPPPALYQRGRYNHTGLGEQLLKRGPAGAVAYIGCNTGSQPCGLTLVEGFVSALSESKEPRLGSCWTAAIRYYHDKERLATLKPNSDWYPPSVFFQGMKFMLFGDPSMRLPGRK